MTLHPAPASPHRRIVGLLLCAMLLMKLVGLWHGVVHVHGPRHPVDAGATTLPEPAGLGGLFAHYDYAADCQVLTS